MTRRKSITFSLKTTSIDKAIARIREEEKYIRNGLERLALRVGTEIEQEINANTASAKIQVSTSKVIGKKQISYLEYRTPEITTSVTQEGNICTVIVSGQDAIWVEFGTGVFYNGAAGSSPNPWGASIGFTIGSYGKGKGKNKAWGYYSGDGEVNITHGTQAQMPIYNACKAVSAKFPTLVKEVFGG